MNKVIEMHTCTNCGNFVTADFVRVFGDSRKRVHACPTCAQMSDIMDGKASQSTSGATPWDVP